MFKEVSEIRKEGMALPYSPDRAGITAARKQDECLLKGASIAASIHKKSLQLEGLCIIRCRSETTQQRKFRFPGGEVNAAGY